MINADSEKRRKTLIRVHLSTAPEAKWSLVFSEGNIMTPAGSTATIDVDVGSGVLETPSQINDRLATAVLESRNIMADVESVTSEAPG